MKRGPWFTVAVLTAANIFAFIDRQVLGLLVIPEEECVAKTTRHSQWAALLLCAFGVFVAFLLVNFYIKPYQTILGTLSDNQTVNWFTGEALHALGWLVLLVSFGALAYWTIGRSYRVTPSDVNSKLVRAVKNFHPDV